ncbi:hypothetical protein MPC4_210042 [Methylocella tundrae]|uniref:Uncharacterized protein n=1 Tax=Methylocella tundrae TaxID=227605 RepID=A0A8B6M5W2_METTU|nr:hypothetical protein MPC4_210042 [Methylocella tundrae]
MAPLRSLASMCGNIPTTSIIAIAGRITSRRSSIISSTGNMSSNSTKRRSPERRRDRHAVSRRRSLKKPGPRHARPRSNPHPARKWSGAGHDRLKRARRSRRFVASRLALLQHIDGAGLGAHHPFRSGAREMHHGADLQIVEASPQHAAAGEVKIRAAFHLHEAMVLLGKQTHHDARLDAVLVPLHISLDDLGKLLKLALNSIENAMDECVLLAFPLRFRLCDDQRPAGHLDFDAEGERRHRIPRSAMRRARDHAAPDDVRVNMFEPLHSLLDELREGLGVLYVAEYDLQRSIHAWSPLVRGRNRSAKKRRRAPAVYINVWQS